MDTQGFALSLGQMRLDFQPTRGDGYGYGLSVRDDDGGEWRCVSARDNPLVRGSTFDLFPTEIHRQDDLTITMRGTHRGDGERDSTGYRGGVDYAYAATVRADPRQNWFRFDVEVDSPRDIPL